MRFQSPRLTPHVFPMTMHIEIYVGRYVLEFADVCSLYPHVGGYLVEFADDYSLKVHVWRKPHVIRSTLLSGFPFVQVLSWKSQTLVP